MNVNAASTGKSLVRISTLEEGQAALSLVQAAHTAVVLSTIYDMPRDIARQVLCDKPVPFVANLVAKDGASGDGGGVLSLLEPAQAAEATICAIVDTGDQMVEYVPISRADFERLIKEGVKRRQLMRAGTFYWWLKIAAPSKVSGDMVYQHVRLILDAPEQDNEWRVATLEALGSTFLALACLCELPDDEGEMLDRLTRLDSRLGISVSRVLGAKDREELEGDVLFQWESLAQEGKIVPAMPPEGMTIMPVSVSVADLAADID